MGSVIDAVLISVGILGMGELVEAWPPMITVVTLAGSVFLFVYGAISFKKMLDPGELRASNELVSLKRAVITMLAFSFLNPHVYLDTVVLVGSIAVQEESQNRIPFGVDQILYSQPKCQKQV